MAADPPPGSPTHGRGRPWCLGRSGAFPSAVNGRCDVKPQGEAGGCAAYWARGDEGDAHEESRFRIRRPISEPWRRACRITIHSKDQWSCADRFLMRQTACAQRFQLIS